MESVAELPADEGAPALRYRVWPEPAGTQPRATLAVLSGVMSNTGWLRPLAERWQALGYRVIGLERQGSGVNSPAGRQATADAGQATGTTDAGPAMGCEDAPSAKVLVDDACRQLAHGAAAGRPVVLVGWCWGAILAVHVALELERVATAGPLLGLALLTPGIHPSAALAERMRALAEQAKDLPPAAPVLESPITDEMFTDGPALDGFIRRDAARWRRFSPRFLDVSTRLTLAARMRLRKLALPVFTALAEHDVTTDNAAIVAELARLPADRVTTVVLPGSHGLQFDAPQALAGRLDAWARDALGV